MPPNKAKTDTMNNRRKGNPISLKIKDMNGQSIFTVQQASKLLQITERTLRNTINQNQLKAYKKFNKWYILLNDLEAFI